MGEAFALFLRHLTVAFEWLPLPHHPSGMTGITKFGGNILNSFGILNGVFFFYFMLTFIFPRKKSPKKRRRKRSYRHRRNPKEHEVTISGLAKFVKRSNLECPCRCSNEKKGSGELKQQEFC